ncbi:hypothetical protein H5410_004444 [Solanum commersonii]|uniref:Uncharacterized protein n=1 Tax=Solanum commersonii TaxID=4109 RepID=A0A9J6B8F5_SOLCO|nr:hypothetical protein H5410_004444 [Solanum commersonii]
MTLDRKEWRWRIKVEEAVFGEPIRGSVYGYPEKAYQKKKSWYCGSASSNFDGGDRDTISQ